MNYYFKVTPENQVGSIHWGMILPWKRTIVELSRDFLEASEVGNL